MNLALLVLFVQCIVKIIHAEPENTCCYMFTRPQLPSFSLPTGWTEDFVLNVNNPIVTYDDSLIGPQGCTSDKFEYYNTETNTWDELVKQGGRLLPVPNFNVTNSQLITFKSLQPSQYDLSQNLNNHYGRIWFSCDKNIRSCAQFSLGGKSIMYIAPQCVPPETTPAPTTTPPPPPTPSPTPEPTEPPFPRPENTCCFKFKYPQIPSFILPPSQPYSPGEVTLNQENPIISSTGVNIKKGCNGQKLEYYSEQHGWISWYIDVDGVKRDDIDVVYVTENDKIKVRTIQTWQSNLPNVLNGRLVRLFMTCDDYYSCAQFTVNGYEEDVSYPKCDKPLTPAPTPSWQTPENDCCYTFAFPNLPSFELPKPADSSVVVLNPNNRLVMYDNKFKSLEGLNCTGSNFRYFDNTTWVSAYTDKDGSIRTDIDLFRVVNEDAIQFIGYRPSQEYFYEKMQNRHGKIDVLCKGRAKSCAMFIIHGKPQFNTTQRCSSSASNTKISFGTLFVLLLVSIMLL